MLPLGANRFAASHVSYAVRNVAAASVSLFKVGWLDHRTLVGPVFERKIADLSLGTCFPSLKYGMLRIAYGVDGRLQLKPRSYLRSSTE